MEAPVSLDYDKSKVPWEGEQRPIEGSPLLASVPGGYTIQMDEGDASDGSPSSRGYLLKPGDQTHVQVQEGIFHEEPTYCCGAKRSPHFRGLTINIILWGTFIFFIVSAILEFGRYDQPIFIAAATLFPVWFLIYLIESFCSGTSQYLWNFDPQENIVAYTNRLRGYAPRISFHCECYHYETEYYTTTDSDGNTKTESRETRVTTHTETEPVHYVRWIDNSGEMNEAVFTHNSTRVNYYKELRFGDERTANEYKRQKRAFIDRNEYRDTHFDFYENNEITDFKSKKMSIVDPANTSCCMNWGTYCMITIFLFASAFYRYWLDRNSVETKFSFIKTIYK